MNARIVLFGATGYTGELVARALVARGERPVLAGRRRSTLEALSAELGGLDTQTADASDPASVRALVEEGDVLVTTVGPFVRYGEPAVRAAVDAGAHYLDSTGEPAFIRRVFEEFGPQAHRSGLLTAFGNDWVPGNLAGGLALREAGAEVRSVEVGYATTGRLSADSVSAGTRSSIAAIALEPSFAYRNGRLVTERVAKRTGRHEVAPGKWRTGVSIGGSEHFALPRLAPTLRDVDVHLCVPQSAIGAMRGLGGVGAAVARLPGAKAVSDRLTRRLVPGSGGGPDAAARARVGVIATATAYDAAGGRLAGVRLTGSNVYDFTADILAWGAATALRGGLQGVGALGPVDGFGLDALKAGAAEVGLVVEA